MKTILVTGSNGLLGQKITEAILNRKQFNLVATGKGLNRFPIQEGYTYMEMDILNDQQVNEVINQVQPDAIIHTAALTQVDQAEENKELCWALNVKATENLVKLCERDKIQFIHLSTDFVFDGENGPYAENDLPNPLSYYGESKLAAENVIRNSNAYWVIIRTLLVYGIIYDRSRSNIVLWAKGALEKGEAIHVVNDQWRMPTLAEDLATACLSAVSNDAQGIFHISGKDYMSVSEIVKAVAEYYNFDARLIHEISSDGLNQIGKRPAKTGFILDKAYSELNYQPHSFKEGLAIVAKQIEARF